MEFFQLDGFISGSLAGTIKKCIKKMKIIIIKNQINKLGCAAVTSTHPFDTIKVCKTYSKSRKASIFQQIPKYF